MEKRIVQINITETTGLDECVKCATRMNPDLIIIENTLNRWIPVSERLPDLHTDVLVALEDNGDTTRDIDCLADWDGTIVWATYHGATDRVLAWMPLPEPYKQE